MAWDCVIVGQEGDVPIDTPFEVANIFGVLVQPDGNNKIMVGIKKSQKRFGSTTNSRFRRLLQDYFKIKNDDFRTE